MNGYGGRILAVDLSTGRSSLEEFDEGFARMYLGGNGFAVRLLYEKLPPRLDPFDPRNILVFAVGPITDTTPSGNSRACVASKSPLTNLFFDSTFGGRFPCTMKRTGFDAIAITGRAERPVYLLVTEQGAQLKPAGDLKGKRIKETVEAIQAVEGEAADVMAIGPAGENLVRFACIGHYWKNREGFSGRGGLGAVMGSKNLKALVVVGTRKTEVARPDALKALNDEVREPMKRGTAALSTYGTPVLVHITNALGALPSYNARTELYQEADLISGETLKERFWEKDTTCLKCPVACGKLYHVKEGEYAGTRAKMPEFETIFAFGTMLGNTNGGSLTKANELCDALGLDTISLGVTLAFAFECFERGLLSEREVGFPLQWGDHRTILRLIQMTAERRGFGDLLAEGSVRLAERLGSGTRPYLYCVKGLELPAHSARGLKGMSIGYATATRGGSHHDTRPTPQYASTFDRKGIEGKPLFAIRSQHFTAVGDSLVLCRFTAERGFGLFLNENYARMVSSVTGWDMEVAELEKIGERVINLERSFNVREGVSRKDDVLPYRVMNEPIPSGPSQGMSCPKEELDGLLDEYYALRGWSKEGIPTEQKLRELGLM